MPTRSPEFIAALDAARGRRLALLAITARLEAAAIVARTGGTTLDVGGVTVSDVPAYCAG